MTLWKHAHVHWEHASLAAQVDLLAFSLCLRPAAHRELHGAWQPRALLTGRQDLEPQDTQRTGTLLAGSEPWYTSQCRSSSYQGGGIWSQGTHGIFGAHLDWEAEFGTAGHVAAHGCMSRSLS
jgi:hypothetical protein